MAGGYHSFTVNFAAGNLTAVGLDSNGAVLDSHTRMTPGKAAKILLQLDAPVPRTGTGTGKVVSDGVDVAMLRATIVDDQGTQVWDDATNVTFKIVSGPATVDGVANGDPACLEPVKSSSRSAYHGLVRAILRSTEVAATSAQHRAALVRMHGGNWTIGGGMTVAAVNGDVPGLPEAATEFVVSASAPGLDTVQLTVPLSTDADTDGVLASASKFAVGAPIGIE